MQTWRNLFREQHISNSVQEFLAYVMSKNLVNFHLERAFLSISLNSKLDSTKALGIKKKWRGQHDLFTQVDSGNVCDIQDTVFGAFLHNIWAETIEDIFLCFSIDKPATSSPAEKNYLLEITSRRNSAAHGRDPLSSIARGLTASELETRLEASNNICQYFMLTLQEHADNLFFIKQEYRDIYRNA